MAHRSSRLPQSFVANRISRARASIDSLEFDLTETNPSRCKFPYPENLLSVLAEPRALTYQPEPRGPLPAREAVAATFERWHCRPSADRVMLTASTSEAYGFLIKLLADPGDSILVPSPSYPLFESLLSLEGVQAVPYSLDPDDDWRPVQAELEAAGDRIRAVIVVHPNNPTGSLVPRDSTTPLVELCRRRGWALIADEVFLPFVHDSEAEAFSFAATSDCLTFTLGGLSKHLGLPQLKVSWLVVSGPPSEVEQALEGLDWVADTVLSVNTPSALALAELLDDPGGLEAAINQRCRCNLKQLESLGLRLKGVTVMAPTGGWSVVVRLPATVDEQAVVLDALAQKVAVHPGYFFDLPFDSALVLSLLPPPDVFSGGLERLVPVLEARLR